MRVSALRTRRLLALLPLWVGLGCATAAPSAAPSAAPRRSMPPSPTTVATRAPRATPKRPQRIAQSERARYSVRCEDDEHCPESVGMLVTPGVPDAERCTASLVAPDRVLTASHCLPPSQRRAGATCSGTWVAFPGTSHREPVWATCAQVLAATALGQGSVLREEYALMRLAEPVDRLTLEVDPSPLAQQSIVTVVSVTPHPAIDSSHRLSTRLCRVDGRQKAVAVLGEQASAVGWLSHCPIERGNSGSPVLDYDGRLRAIVHGGTFTGYERGITSRPPNL